MLCNLHGSFFFGCTLLAAGGSLSTGVCGNESVGSKTARPARGAARRIQQASGGSRTRLTPAPAPWCALVPK